MVSVYRVLSEYDSMHHDSYVSENSSLLVICRQ